MRALHWVWALALLPALTCARAPRPEQLRDTRPNLLLVVIDTLRADRLGAYGHTAATSPNIDASLARAGALALQAYAPAPWTVPSMAGLLTGLGPGRLMRSAADGLPPGVPTLAERLRAAGYHTILAGANPTLEPRLGFARGFEQVSLPPAELSALLRHADDLDRRARPLLAQAREPFFMLLHYLDPHDPYDNPEIVQGRSRFWPQYPGRLRGDWIHGLYEGKLRLDDPQADRRQLAALYDAEVAYVDRFVAAALGALPAPVRARTLTVLTADHGEELYERGGFKHGQTLYEEQWRVPLLVRWDGHVPAGTRLTTPVSLLDVAPTLLAAAGLPAPQPADGQSLLPALLGHAQPAARELYARHLAGGPLRLAVRAGRFKLQLFDRRAPFAPQDALDATLWRRDLGRLPRVMLHDLERDPGEQQDLAGQEPDLLAQLSARAEARLARELPGLWLGAAPLPAGQHLDVRLRFDREVPTHQALFLAEGDRVRVRGRELDWHLGSDGIRRGLCFSGPFTWVALVRADLDGQPLASERIALGATRTHAGSDAAGAPRTLSPAALAAPEPPGHADTLLRLWLSEPPSWWPRAENTQAAERLRALGYVP
jgi:arylsulfatase A-like enzyme